MIFWCGVIAVAYLFYKWAIANYDYFEKRGVAFIEPMFLLGSNSNMFFNKLSFPEIVIKWYNDSRVVNEKWELRNNLKYYKENLHFIKFHPDRIYGMFEFRKPVFFVRDPKLAKKLAIKDFDYFVDHRVVLDENTDKLFGKSLISLQGQKWRGKNHIKWI